MPRSTWNPCDGAIALAPSMLAADFGHLADAVASLEGSGAERLHVDVMDGVFVPNFTFGTDTVRALRRETDLPLELHLMITDPDRHLETFAEAGADGITVHYEACPHLHRTLTHIRDARLPFGRRHQPEHAGIEPRRRARGLRPGAGDDDRPGLRRPEADPSDADEGGTGPGRDRAPGPAAPTLEVDGGVDASNARACVEAGANVLVAGTAVFGHASGPAAGGQAVLAAAAGASA